MLIYCYIKMLCVNSYLGGYNFVFSVALTPESLNR